MSPYHEIITNKLGKENVYTSQMENWFILSNEVNYVQYYTYPKNFLRLSVKALDEKNHR